MQNLRISDLEILPRSSKIRLMMYFLMNLTIAFRDITSDDSENINRKLNGINQIQHMILPYLIGLYENSKESYTDKIISQNLIDMAESYDLKTQISYSWTLAISAIISDFEPSSKEYLV